jgi:predicted Fe-Mo cluster-binding NifX family protein
MTVAIPQYLDDIAPCFEAANSFLISTTEEGEESSPKIVRCSLCDGLTQVRLMRENGVDVLVCNGIKRVFRDMLQNDGVMVITNITFPVEQALKMFYRGELKSCARPDAETDYCPRISLNDLICWAKDLFESHGYSVRSGPALAPFLIDLVAEIGCPQCGKKIRVAVCCGAHIYRGDQEIRQFHLSTGINYDARVYVHPATSELVECCREYGIGFIDPDSEPAPRKADARKYIPLLTSAIPGHETAFGGGMRSR